MTAERDRALDHARDHAVPAGFRARVLRGDEVDAAGLFEDLLATWVAVSDAGGAVGFVPPAAPADVAPTLERVLCKVRGGVDDLVVVSRDCPDGALRTSTAGLGRYVGMAVLADNGSPLLAHWRMVMRVMVHPALQRQGVGGLLMDEVHRHAAAAGLDHLVLLVRTGQGIEPFYRRLGYREIGLHPRAVAVAPDDVRDEVMMFRALSADRPRQAAG